MSTRPHHAGRNAGLAAVFALTTAVLANDEVKLGGPEVTKLDWNTRALQAVDLNGDGANDLLVINNDRARVDFLYQVKPGAPAELPKRAVTTDRWEPVLEDARFRKASLTTGLGMFDLAAGDLNGDGRPDLAYTGDPDTLTIRYQQADGEWSEKKVVEVPAPLQWLSGLKIADLDGDGRRDLVMMAQKELVVVRQNARGLLEAPERYPLADENSYGLEPADVNGDGRIDFVYLAPNVRDALRLRLQHPAGHYGPEQSHPIDAARSTLQVLGSGPGQNATVAYVLGQTGQVEVFAVEPRRDDASAAGAPLPRPRVYSTRIGARTPAAYAFGDFNGDGLTDVAMSDPEAAQVALFFREKSGGFGPARKFPSLADSRSIAACDWDGDGRDEVIVASSKEQTLAVAGVEAGEGRLGYPQPLPGKGKPLAVAAGRLAATATPYVVCVREEGGKRLVDLWARGGGTPQVVKSIELAGLKTDPRSVRLADANQDGRMDIAVFTPFEPMRLLVQREGIAFEEVSQGAGYRKGLVDNLEASAFTLEDVDGDGRKEMLVAGTGFVRALRLNEKGELTVVDQYNARENTSDIAAALVLPGKAQAANRRRLLLLDKKADAFQVLQPDAAGVYAFTESVPAGKIDLVAAERRETPGGGAEIFFLGKDRFWWLPLGQPEWQVKVLKTYTTDLRSVSYSDVLGADLNSDGRLELVCNDPVRNVIEILGTGPDGEWHSRMHFKVFETDAHYQGRKGAAQEPRESIAADVTGDGKNDLVLLVHDRVLVYPQE
ncbi:MAG: hypothetical protein A3G75_15015 [Verrucomicrobia bacterium RIFCSPLOWO2_12_FULL_64_8]|nr:MAG: hypothetical protein A3G75_15015 [Verrucomicrobia bacterium RIFCSPLOWO2_12_FULL_64_8]